jgi:hypothetical protein
MINMIMPSLPAAASSSDRRRHSHPDCRATGRLDARREKLQTLRHGIDAIWPVIAGFENSLNAEQKKSFDTMVNASSDFRRLAP